MATNHRHLLAVEVLADLVYRHRLPVEWNALPSTGVLALYAPHTEPLAELVYALADYITEMRPTLPTYDPLAELVRDCVFADLRNGRRALVLPGVLLA